MRLITVTMALTVVTIVWTELGYGLPRNQVEHAYFTDSSFEQEAGFEIRPTCSGRPSPLQGRRTRFVVRQSEPCNGGSRIREIDCFLDGRRTSCPANICDSHLVTCS